MRSLRWSCWIHSPSLSWIICCLLFLSSPGGGACFHTAQWAVCPRVCVTLLCVCVYACNICPKHQTRGWIEPMWQTESRLFNEKVDERWHSLATFHTHHRQHSPPPHFHSLQHSDFHLDELSRHWVVTVTTSNNVYIFKKKKLNT